MVVLVSALSPVSAIHKYKSILTRNCNTVFPFDSGLTHSRQKLSEHTSLRCRAELHGGMALQAHARLELGWGGHAALNEDKTFPGSVFLLLLPDTSKNYEIRELLG